MKKQNLTFLLAGSIAMLMASCGGDSGEQEKMPTTDDQAVVEPQKSQNVGFGEQGGKTYAVPSPNELFSIIKDSKLPYKEGLISTESIKYSSSKNQALNFGRITADIAYTASYERFQESMGNFENLRKIGDDLGISYVFDELMVNRVKSNMDNADSLEVISTSSYQRIIGMLEENEKGSTLAIIAAGGFVESIYILTHLINDYDKNTAVVSRLADEKIVLENIIDYLNMYKEEDRVNEVLNEMKGISDIFLNLKEVEKAAQKSTKGEKMVIGGSSVEMSKEEFNALKTAATTYRNSFANASKS